MLEFCIQEVNHFLSILIRVFRDTNRDSMGTFCLQLLQQFYQKIVEEIKY